MTLSQKVIFTQAISFGTTTKSISTPTNACTSYQTANLIDLLSKSLGQTKEISGIINNYNKDVPIGQWNWKEDAEMALQYCEWIENGTWPSETKGYQTNLNGIIFKN